MANQTGAFAHLDSLAPIDRASQAPNRAVPLAILGGSAMIAAAAFLALYIFRPQPAQPVAASVGMPSAVGVAEQAPPAAAAEPVAPEPVAAPAEVARAEAKPEPEAEPEGEPIARTPAPASHAAKSQKVVSAKRAAAIEHPSARPAKSEPARASAKEPKEIRLGEEAFDRRHVARRQRQEGRVQARAQGRAHAR